MRSIGLLVLMVMPHLAQGQCENSEGDASSRAEGTPGSIIEASVERARAEAMNAELAAIQASSRGESEAVFFVDIFDGLMPIPNRFVPLARSPGQFNSRSIFGSPLESLVALSGTIQIGQLSSENQPPLSPPEGFKPCNESTQSLHGLTAVIWEFESFSHVYIHDDMEFIRITNENKQLWRAMIDSWNELPRN